MNYEVYRAMKNAIDTEYVKIRLSGKNAFSERELTPEEMAEIESVFDIFSLFLRAKIVD